nr:KH domain-containing, RNA-binding, signal transduction-associated protein 3-like [Onthophagus taurus]
MAERYESPVSAPGQYSTEYKRKSSSSNNNSEEKPGEESANQHEKLNEYIRDLLAEKQLLDELKSPHACRLIEQEIQKAQTTGKIPGKDQKFVDIYRERPMKVSVKVLVPVREHPKFNFVGKLLGPKGNSMKRLQEETMCKMAVLGRGSMKDRQKEEELRQSLDPKYAHLGDDLHVEISALGPPAEAHARVAYALAEVRKYLIPDNNDNIRQEQMREMEIMTSDDGVETRTEVRRPPVMRSQGPTRQPIPRPPVQMRTATRVPVPTPRVMPAKTKILSILDRARVAMEESYGYEDTYDPADPGYDHYPPSSGHGRSYSTGHSYEAEYETDYYREASSSYGKLKVIQTKRDLKRG